jgi:hypothetical protein
MQIISTLIKRKYFNEILSGEKVIEYREIKPYWIKKLTTIQLPFILQITSGLKKDSPTAYIQINKITTEKIKLMDALELINCYALHIEKIISWENI